MKFCLLTDFNNIFDKILSKFTGGDWGEGIGGRFANEHFNLTKFFN